MRLNRLKHTRDIRTSVNLDGLLETNRMYDEELPLLKEKNNQSLIEGFLAAKNLMNLPGHLNSKLKNKKLDQSLSYIHNAKSQER